MVQRRGIGLTAYNVFCIMSHTEGLMKRFWKDNGLTETIIGLILGIGAAAIIALWSN